MRNPIRLLQLYRAAQAAFNYGVEKGIPGLEFNRFGRQLGWRLLARSPRVALEYLLTPVNFIRYYEFPFALSCLGPTPGRCLDVSSPRLFSLYVAAHLPVESLVMANPDVADASRTQSMVRALGYERVAVRNEGVGALAAGERDYDHIWSISVIEHIAGDVDDSNAVRLMYDALAKGGRLILTVPVDKAFRLEYRDRDAYGTQQAVAPERYFFQRVYDEAAVRERIVAAVGREPSLVKWYGETVPGHYADYDMRCSQVGRPVAVGDPRAIADFYREYESWQQMPGMGVCGMMFEKPS